MWLGATRVVTVGVGHNLLIITHTHKGHNHAFILFFPSPCQLLPYTVNSRILYYDGASSLPVSTVFLMVRQWSPYHTCPMDTGAGRELKQIMRILGELSSPARLSLKGTASSSIKFVCDLLFYLRQVSL